MTKVSLARICGLMSGRPDIQDPRSVEKDWRWGMKREGIEAMKMGPRYGMGGLWLKKHYNSKGQNPVVHSFKCLDCPLS